MKKTEKEKQWLREYYHRNKEKFKEKSKRYRELHREELNKYRRDYQQINKIKLNEITREYRMLHPEKVNQYEKKRRLKHKASLIKKQNIRRKNNRNKFNAQQQAERNIPLKDRCDICKSTNNLQRHHWRYDKPLLVATLCRICHKIQHVKNFERWHECKLEANKQLEVVQ